MPRQHLAIGNVGLGDMRIDLMAGALPAGPRPAVSSRPRILVFDSGLGGLTVLEAIRRTRPDADYVYAADDAAFPYGGLSEPILVARVLAVMERLLRRHAPDLVVIACNTASTLVLPALRQRYVTPFVGVVPPIKPAAAATRSGVIALLATPGTVARAYTRDLVETHAAAHDVTLVGAPNLARLAEAEMAGAPVADADLMVEIAPCFVERDGGRRTDVVCLACTHYPLLRPRFETLAPWPVAWIDPAPAIARRVVQLIGNGPDATEPPRSMLATFTGGAGVTEALSATLARRGIDEIVTDPLPLG